MSEHKRYTIGNGELHFINHEGFSDVSGTVELASLQYGEEDQPLSTGPILLTRECHLDIECYSPKGLVFMQGQSLGKSDSTIPNHVRRTWQVEARKEYLEYLARTFGTDVSDICDEVSRFVVRVKPWPPEPELEVWAREAVKQILADTYNHQPPLWAKSWKRKGKHSK